MIRVSSIVFPTGMKNIWSRIRASNEKKIAVSVSPRCVTNRMILANHGFLELEFSLR
ncbi:hypothetical protein QE109_17305 [Fusibacter bizertensis]|uniref:Uncharacterized protein n=1 Tax=Fusibacter bizertensis TaxID=1488331 RepID=A0ABT6NHJ3_9FIRM|nr:hypothetical protein [Fusibacter bizertensis]MDH8679908.1 hypothetical protein [Fusibacter bizertensis]